jgi:transcriptional regulator with PAS, ATPase and Fis domain
MQKVFAAIDKAAPVNCNVLIQGETGTGKELVAMALHRGSVRRGGPFVSFNCASFSEELMANELFGHEKGAFTGASAMKPGLFETAHNGTIFLDELGDMPLAMQTKLMRVIQQREFMRVGGVTPIKIDIRIVGATNRNLKLMMDSGEFRSDIFYRLNVVFIELPPLRERKEDIPLLVRHFIGKYNTVFDRKVTKTTAAFLDALIAYSFPGNVRELENIVERAVAFANGDCLDSADLPPDLDLLRLAGNAEDEPHSLKEHESDYIKKIYSHAGGNQERTAELLGISRTTLWRRLKEMDLI